MHPLDTIIEIKFVGNLDGVLLILKFGTLSMVQVHSARLSKKETFLPDHHESL